jgi:hypothetical protein
MKSNVTKVALGALGLGYLAGAGVGVGEGNDEARADAGAVWDAARRSYVTGDADSLTLWRLEGGQVTEATRYALQTRGGTAVLGPNGRFFGGGNFVVSSTFKPADGGRAAPSGAMMREPARPRPSATAPAPAPRPPAPTLPPPPRVPPAGGQMSCGAGRCG